MSDNELIAEFMGWERYSQNSFKCPNIYPVENSTSYGWTTFSADQFQFTDSWDWIMPVVQKITKTTSPMNQAWYDVKYRLMDADITAVYEAVVRFIKWYNDQNK